MVKGGMCGEGSGIFGGGMCDRKGSHCSGWYASYWNAFLF